MVQQRSRLARPLLLWQPCGQIFETHRMRKVAPGQERCKMETNFSSAPETHDGYRAFPALSR